MRDAFWSVEDVSSEDGSDLTKVSFFLLFLDCSELIIYLNI